MPFKTGARSIAAVALLSNTMAVEPGDVGAVGFPVVVLAGRDNLTTPPGLVEAWYQRLAAPSKQRVWFEPFAHLSPLGALGRTLNALVEQVLPPMSPHP